MARKPLGRGLSALLGDDAEIETIERSSINEIDVDLIRPNPQQPRTRFPDGALDDLAQSIAVNGIVQPIVVRPKDGRFEIVAGERRWRAAQRAGLRKIPAAVREVSDDKLLELALIENIQREQLNPIEEAKAYRKLIENIGLTQEEVSARVGRERTLIATTVRLLQLPDDLQGLIEEGKLTTGHGRAILMAEGPNSQRRIARRVIDEGLSVRETEKAVKRSFKSGQTAENKKVSSKKDANFALAETKMARKLGTNVKIVPKGTGKAGRIEIQYYNTDDLDRIYQVIMGN